jgi:hypothetical protein
MIQMGTTSISFRVRKIMTPRMLWGPQHPRQIPLPNLTFNCFHHPTTRGPAHPSISDALGGLELLEVRTVQRVSILLRGADRLDEVAEDLCASDKTWELHG